MKQQTQEIQHSNVEERRSFLQKGLSTAGIILSAGAVSTLLNSCEDEIKNPIDPPSEGETLNIADISELAVVGGATKRTILNLQSQALVIVRVSDTEFLVASELCSHQKCPVNLPGTDGNDNIRCPCHGAEFSTTDASVISFPSDGTTEAPLKTYPSTFDAETNILTITAA
jgi:nitrite reductase/ring-hydroxylating ferredoxin subunit